MVLSLICYFDRVLCVGFLKELLIGHGLGRPFYPPKGNLLTAKNVVYARESRLTEHTY